jgi:4-oxalocrotonate tautomerase
MKRHANVRGNMSKLGKKYHREGGNHMPVIRVDIGKQGLSVEQKKQLIEKLTDTAVEVTRIPKHAYTVIISEYDDSNIGVGGLTLDKVRKP